MNKYCSKLPMITIGVPNVSILSSGITGHNRNRIARHAGKRAPYPQPTAIRVARRRRSGHLTSNEAHNSSATNALSS
jgi:hypothetical protein